MVGALASHHCGSGSILASVICGLSLLLVSPCAEGLSLGIPVFLPREKTNISNGKLEKQQRPKGLPL